MKSDDNEEEKRKEKEKLEREREEAERIARDAAMITAINAAIITCCII